MKPNREKAVFMREARFKLTKGKVCRSSLDDFQRLAPWHFLTGFERR